MLRIPLLPAATAALVLSLSAARDIGAKAHGLSLEVAGLPSEPTAIVWERLPLLRSERVALFTGVEKVNAFNHHPTLVWHAGRFLAAWSNGAKDEDASGQRIFYATSQDGREW